MYFFKLSWIKLLFFFFIVSIPFVSSGQLLDQGLLSRHVAISVFLLFFSSYLIIQRKKVNGSINLSPLVFAFFALLMAFALSCLTAYNKTEAVYWLAKIALYFSCFMIFYLLMINEKLDMQFLGRPFCFFALCGLLLLTIEWLSLEGKGIQLFEKKNLYMLHSPFFHKNLFSSIMFLSLPLIVRVLLFDKKVWKYFAVFVLIGIGLSFIALQTKAVLLAVLIGTLVCLIPFLKVFSGIYPNQVKRLGWALTSGIFAFISIVLVNKDKFVLLFDNETLHERWLVWGNTFMMIKEHMVLGVGAGNWQVFFPKYGLGNFSGNNFMVSLGYTTFQRPHNDFLWIWAETGLPGIVSYLLIFVFCFILLFRLIKSKINKPIEALWDLSILFALSGYVVVAFFDFPLERTEHQVFFAILAAIVLARAQKEKLLKTRFNTGVFNMAFLVIVCVGFSLFVSFQRFKAEKATKNVLIAHKVQNWNKLLREANSINQNWLNMDNFSIPISWYTGFAHYKLNNYQKARHDFERAALIAPYQLNVINNLAGLYEMDGKREKALELYNAALAISPSHHEAILNKSATLFNLGRVEEAFLSICEFDYDPWNQDYQNFLKQITVAFVQQKLKEEKDPVKTFKLQALLANEKMLQKAFKESKENNKDFLTVANKMFD